MGPNALIAAQRAIAEARDALAPEIARAMAVTQVWRAANQLGHAIERLEEIERGNIPADYALAEPRQQAKRVVL